MGKDKVIKGLECCTRYPNEYGDCLGGDCPYGPRIDCHKELTRDALALLKAQEEEINGLRQLVEWAVDCGFGYDNIPEYYGMYEDKIGDMGYTEGLVYIAKEVAKHG